MAQKYDYNALVTINLNVIPVYTLFGVKQTYEFSIMSYGEWVILQEDTPKYYFNIFDPMYDSVRDEIKDTGSMIKFLEHGFQVNNIPLSIKRPLWGIYLYSKEKMKSFTIEKFPLEILLKIVNN